MIEMRLYFFKTVFMVLGKCPYVFYCLPTYQLQKLFAFFCQYGEDALPEQSDMETIILISLSVQWRSWSSQPDWQHCKMSLWLTLSVNLSPPKKDSFILQNHHHQMKVRHPADSKHWREMRHILLRDNRPFFAPLSSLQVSHQRASLIQMMRHNKTLLWQSEG